MKRTFSEIVMLMLVEAQLPAHFCAELTKHADVPRVKELVEIWDASDSDDVSCVETALQDTLYDISRVPVPMNDTQLLSDDELCELVKDAYKESRRQKAFMIQIITREGGVENVARLLGIPCNALKNAVSSNRTHNRGYYEHIKSVFGRKKDGN